MKILQILAGGRFGGAETAFADMCLALHESGEEVEVVTRSHPERLARLQKAGLRVHTLPFGSPIDIYTPFKLKKIIRQFKPDIVQTWMSRASYKTPRWASSMRIPRYLTVARLGGYYKMRYFKNTDYFVTITPDIRRYLIDKGVAPEDVRHINNFAETEIPEKPVARQDLQTPEEAPVLLALGRLHQAKAFDTLLKALVKTPGVYLWIAGEGPDRAELEDLCRKLNLDERVRFLGWRSDRAALFQSADICVFPSRYEPFGTVFVQAWAQKRPLVVSDADGPRQFVRDGEDGLVFPIDDIDALASAINKVVGDKDLQASLIDKGYKRYQGEFTKDKTVAAYLDWYREIRLR